MKRLLIMLLLATPCFAQITAYPGQSGNTVGYQGFNSTLSTAACPDLATSGTSTNWRVVSGKCTSQATISGNYIICVSCDIQGGIVLSGDHIACWGCRVGAQSVGSYQGGFDCTNCYFVYSTLGPLASFYTSPPGGAWPSAGAGTNTDTCVSGTTCIPYADSYQYGVSTTVSTSGPVTVDHSDIWGFGNAINYIAATTAQMIDTNDWIHDPSYDNAGAYHTDGIGYLNGGAAPSNIFMQGNTIGFMGNTHDIAMQQGTSGYSGIYAVQNYLTGDEFAASWCSPGTVNCTNSAFWGNIYGTDIMPQLDVLYTPATIAASSTWGCNTLKFVAGTTWTSSGGFTPTSGMNGEFWLPGGGHDFSATDYGSNTKCPLLSTGSLVWKQQQKNVTSASLSVTLTNAGSASLTISSVALASGTQYSITSNTCGASLAASASCTVSISFTPSIIGVQTDTLQITDNAPAPYTVQKVPLIGYGATSGGTSGASTPVPSPAAGTYVGTRTVTLSNPSSAPVICWNTTGSPATDGTTGCTAGSSIYSGGIIVSTSETLYFVAGGTGFADSAVGSAAYTIQPLGIRSAARVMAMNR